MALQEDENTWVLELEAALYDTEVPSASDIYAICKGKAIPVYLRPEAWEACLDVTDRGNQLSHFNEVFDLLEQNIIRDDCQQFVAKLGNNDEVKVCVLSDLESILTFYCKSKEKQYKRGNGWIELLGPLIDLKLLRRVTYNLFEAIIDIYIPRGEAYSSVLRLLLLYHEPELCSFLDTKRISPDQYARGWVTTLFSGVCSLPAVCTMWDLYFMQADPFFMLFLSLIMVINAREQILSMKDNDKQSIIDAIAAMPCALEAEDVTDFCSLAQYYAMKTPSSFKQDLYPIMFGEGYDEKYISHALCLPVSAQELVENSIESPSTPNTTVESVRFFLVDCRPAEQYNAGHLPTAFHLDCNLMLQEPAAFATAVQGLLQAQRQALAVGSQAGGEHLCFLGSGRQEEDRYTHMVVASFLQKHTQYVSMVTSGYQAIHEYFGDEVVSSLVDHNSQHCLVCNANISETNSNESSPARVKNNNSDLLGKIKKVKEKLFDYIVNPSASVHNNVENRNGKDPEYTKRQKKTAPVFSIDDDQELDMTMTNHESEEPIEVVSIQQWMKDPKLLHSFKCQEVKVNRDLCDSILLVTDTHLIVLREIPERKGAAHVIVKRPLTSIVKITSRKRHSDLITFKYGTTQYNDTVISDMDKFLIPNATEATKLITQQILKQLKQTN
ncbi:PREDICTED: TBC1 domain family member 23 [Dufourea novaeangliae]|uniref:TBC1 domain family member 23 n=1 Tax=Dufourea novaeangliae TaxID=178035 RepID=A0A154PQ30_DUFNO|nr:PREDICTED: TBC1 domain family member 23 [Dufourea novaeangliae]KZC14003.1 TBC1 domain family member 23 [Dufourea novaeangliae]